MVSTLFNARIAGITKLKQNIKDVTIVSMKETNHMVHWDNTQKIANATHNWITKQLLNYHENKLLQLRKKAIKKRALSIFKEIEIVKMH